MPLLTLLRTIHTSPLLLDAMSVPGGPAKEFSCNIWPEGSATSCSSAATSSNWVTALVDGHQWSPLLYNIIFWNWLCIAWELGWVRGRNAGKLLEEVVLISSSLIEMWLVFLVWKSLELITAPILCTLDLTLWRDSLRQSLADWCVFSIHRVSPKLVIRDLIKIDASCDWHSQSLSLSKNASLHTAPKRKWRDCRGLMWLPAKSSSSIFKSSFHSACIFVCVAFTWSALLDNSPLYLRGGLKNWEAKLAALFPIRITRKS